MFENFYPVNWTGSVVVTSQQDPGLVAAKKGAFTGTQDDMAVKPTYSDNQFWKTP